MVSYLKSILFTFRLYLYKLHPAKNIISLSINKDVIEQFSGEYISY